MKSALLTRAFLVCPRIRIGVHMNPNDEPQNDDEPQILRIGVHMNPNDEPQNDLMNPKFSGSNYYINVRYSQSLNPLVPWLFPTDDKH